MSTGSQEGRTRRTSPKPAVPPAVRYRRGGVVTHHASFFLSPTRRGGRCEISLFARRARARRGIMKVGNRSALQPGCAVPYLIDGYNLLHAMGVLRGSTGPN